jgi:lathosterol oxidase
MINGTSYLLVPILVVVNVTFFFVAGGLLHWAFHRGPASRPLKWRHQPSKRQTRAMMMTKVPLVICNGVLLNTMIGFGIVFASGRLGSAYWDPRAHGIPYLIFSTLALFPFYHFALYYFHRNMHRPALFRRFHHLHHRFKAPMFLDALYEHPFEAFYGGIVITAPLFLFPVNVYGFFLYFSVVGVHEIIDHSGIKIDLPFLSRSRHHDDHHLRSNCYYGQLLSVLDNAHGSVLDDKGRLPRRSVG